MGSEASKIMENIKREELVGRLQKLYDANKLKEQDELTILDTIEYLGGKISW